MDEVWYCISGKGIIWQANENEAEEMEFKIGDSFIIPAGNSFQFRNTGTESLCIVISTMPKWPGKNEAVEVTGRW